jgi:hypothetical protein
VILLLERDYVKERVSGGRKGRQEDDDELPKKPAAKLSADLSIRSWDSVDELEGVSEQGGGRTGEKAKTTNRFGKQVSCPP